MTRSELIDLLIDCHMDSIYQGGDPDQYLRELFRYGNSYPGYTNMTNDQLISLWNTEYCTDDDVIINLE
jgi:hypothetical protein